jgi:hypothetical protein
LERERIMGAADRRLQRETGWDGIAAGAGRISRRPVPAASRGETDVLATRIWASPGRLALARRLAAAIDGIRIHGMERVRGMAWSALETARRDPGARAAGDEALRDIVPMLAEAWRWRLALGRVTRLAWGLAAVGAVAGALLLTRPEAGFAGYAVLIASPALALALRVGIEEVCLWRLRRRHRLGREVLVFLLKALLPDRRWQEPDDRRPGRSVGR